ncbi:MAG: flagellar biosynthetic protein FliO [Dehalococcoidia bacterium]
MRAALRSAAVAAGAIAALALASASAQETGDVGTGVTSFGAGDWFGLAVRLGVVIAIIWVAVAGMRWYVRRMNGGARRGGRGALEVIETHALGPNRTLHLVRLGDRAVLVGATPERITSLLSVDDPDELKRLLDRPEETPARAPGVPSLFSSLVTGVATMNARRSEMNARLKAQRAAAVPPPEAATAPRARRFEGLRDALGRASRASAGARRPRRAAAAAVPEPETRQSLFDRTLASIDALEIAPASSSAAGLRARTGYGQAGARPSTSEARTAPAGGRMRDAQIADLQRAIAAARRNAG